MRAELSSGTVVVGVDSYLFSPLTRAHADFVARRLARKIFGFRRDSSARLWRSLRLRSVSGEVRNRADPGLEAPPRAGA
ncbi:hypothetical protein MES5069_190155 [Mesorhizobium escarrei]|uniref:Uncharacterized protein n=1 Tax=Mesorhizobium escarrei TaxID=666018 RepID=A0ABM9DNH8_9HYPH|nr:hypothetical protein MES5069_190155 [Mesorhizobium escarrei]